MKARWLFLVKTYKMRKTAIKLATFDVTPELAKSPILSAAKEQAELNRANYA